MNQPTPQTVLVIDDCPQIRVSTTCLLENNGFISIAAASPLEAQKLIREKRVDLILLDMNYSDDASSGVEGLNFLAWKQQENITTPTIAITGWSNIEIAVKAMQRGACDFLEKPWNVQRLLQVVRQELALFDLKSQNEKLIQQLETEAIGETQFEWQSPCMKKLLAQIRSVSAPDVAIMLTGENGTGKSWLAQYIHVHSLRKSHAFISVNMGAISESLFESEMFGHKRGAFTDAKNSRIGRFELANHGTLFLDEIANIPLSQQAKLLHVLESGEFEVLGSSHKQFSDIRIVSASNGDFSKLIATEAFREDLYYRLNTLEFRVPSLRERTVDIIPLANFYLEIFSKKYNRDGLQLNADAQNAINAYEWPGNLRELNHLMERAVLLARRNIIDCEDLHLSKIQAGGMSSNCVLPQLKLENAEKILIRQALSACDNSISKAANMLGISRPSLYRRLEKYAELKPQKDPA